MKKYKTVTFGCSFSTKKGVENKLQEVLDEYSAQGWILHSWQISLGEIVVVVFEKDE